MVPHAIIRLRSSTPKRVLVPLESVRSNLYLMPKTALIRIIPSYYICFYPDPALPSPTSQFVRLLSLAFLSGCPACDNPVDRLGLLPAKLLSYHRIICASTLAPPYPALPCNSPVCSSSRFHQDALLAVTRSIGWGCLRSCWMRSCLVAGSDHERYLLASESLRFVITNGGHSKAAAFLLVRTSGRFRWEGLL